MIEVNGVDTAEANSSPQSPIDLTLAKVVSKSFNLFFCVKKWREFADLTRTSQCCSLHLNFSKTGASVIKIRNIVKVCDQLQV